MPEGTTYVSDRKPCGCLKSIECSHKNLQVDPSKGFDAPETNYSHEPASTLTFDPSKFLREPPEVELTLAQRGSRYGDFLDNARVSQDLKRICEPSMVKMNDVQREGLTMILQKIARICNGDPNYADNWHDIQGYAKLVEDRLPKE